MPVDANDVTGLVRPLRRRGRRATGEAGGGGREAHAAGAAVGYSAADPAQTHAVLSNHVVMDAPLHGDGVASPAAAAAAASRARAAWRAILARVRASQC